MYLGVTNTGYSTSFFTPTILKQLGWTSVHAQVMSIPIYLVAAFFSLSAAALSDHLRHRFTFIIVGICISSVGFIVLLAQSNVSVAGRYVAIYVIMSGGYIAQPIIIVWLVNNMGGHYKRSVAAAMQIGFGNSAGIIASNIYLMTEAPTYPTGYGVSLGLLYVSLVAAVVMLVGLRLENSKRERGGRDSRYNLPEEEKNNLGDDHPRFRFVY